MAAEREEVVVDADPLDAEQLLPDREQPLFGRVARRHQRPAALRRAAGSRQPPPVDLAVRGERQGVEQHEGGRHHVVGQARLQEGAQLGDDAAGEPALEGVVGVGGEGGGAAPAGRCPGSASPASGPTASRRARSEHRLERSIRAVIGPAQLDLVGQVFRRVPEVLRLDGSDGRLRRRGGGGRRRFRSPRGLRAAAGPPRRPRRRGRSECCAGGATGGASSASRRRRAARVSPSRRQSRTPSWTAPPARSRPAARPGSGSRSARCGRGRAWDGSRCGRASAAAPAGR